MKNIHATVMTSLCALAFGGCAMHAGTTATAADAPASEEKAKSDSAVADKSAPSSTVGQKVQEQKTAAKLVFQLENAGLAAPEAILYDAEQDVYFVSNVNGQPLDADGNGFISKISPEGKVLELKFIDGANGKVTLDAPKGMAISGNILYVSDITWVRMFDKNTGEPKGKLFAQGASFLNDMTVDKDGVVYVSDSGYKAGAKGFENTGSDTVFRIDPKKVMTEAVLKDRALGNPNGLVTRKDGLWAVNGGGQLFHLSADGKMDQSTKLAKGQLDGVVSLEDGTFLVSSWEGAAIYRGKPGGEFTAVVSDLKSPADIGYDSKRELLLVPSMGEDRMLAYQLNAGEGMAPAKAPQPSSDQNKPTAGAASVEAPGQQKPATSAAKTEPAKPATPAAKAAPAKPATPAAKTEPAKPATPAAKAAPAKPATPAKKAEPAKPATPTKNAEPAKPATPAKKAAPAQPSAKPEAKSEPPRAVPADPKAETPKAATPSPQASAKAAPSAPKSGAK